MSWQLGVHAILSSFIVAVVFGLYDSASNIIDLTSSNFNRQVLSSDEIWIVEFYAPWCGHCKALVPEYIKAGKGLKGVVKVGAVNADEHKSLAGQYGIQGFPTIKIFSQNKNKPEDYSGPRTSQGLIDAAFRALHNLVDSQLGKKSSSSGGSSSSSSGGGSCGGGGGDSSGSKHGDNNDVIELTDGNFEKMVLQSEDMWLVEFYAPWCGHCKNLAPHWASAASELKGKVKLGALDATVHTLMATKYGVRGFPTIKHFPSGKKTDAEEYDGGRTSGDIVQWALEKAAQNIPPPEILQITDESVLTKACEGHQLCIVAVLPHILDCQTSCRNNYLGVLNKLGDKFKKNMWGWLWVEAGAQMELEENLGIGGFGYPALAAANVRKMKYSWLRGAFSYDGINEFLRELAVGRGSTAPLKGASLPKVVKTEPWDGKDGKLEIEDDYPSDGDLDEDSNKDEL